MFRYIILYYIRFYYTILYYILIKQILHGRSMNIKIYSSEVSNIMEIHVIFKDGNLLRTSPHKMVKHTKTFRRQKPTNCLTVFDLFVGLPFKG